MDHILETATYGAPKQSWEHGARKIVKDLATKYGLDARKKVKREFADILSKPENIEELEDVIEAWFQNAWSALLKVSSPPEEVTPAVKKPSISLKAEVAAKSEERSQKLASIIQLDNVLATKKAQIILRDMILPTGKALKDSTYGECADAGGWLSKVGSLGAADQIVSLSEDELAKLYENCN